MIYINIYILYIYRVRGWAILYISHHMGCWGPTIMNPEWLMWAASEHLDEGLEISDQL